MQKYQKLLCKVHQLPLAYICCSSECQLETIGCQQCKPRHIQHDKKVLQFLQFVLHLRNTVQRYQISRSQMSKVVESLKNSLNQYPKIFYLQDEKSVLGTIMKKLEKQQQQISKKFEELQKSRRTIYFERLVERDLLRYRFLLSSSQGIDNFYQQYHQYCQQKDRIQESSIEENQQLAYKQALQGTFTNNLSNFIKLKVSRNDMLKFCKGRVKDQQRGHPPVNKQRRIEQKKNFVGKTETYIR